MGLYTDEPGRDPAQWEPVAYADADREIRRMREARALPALGEAAERAIVAVRPLRAEFADHAGIAAWLESARATLVDAYARAGLAVLLDLETDAFPGLLEARMELVAAETTGADMTRAELAFRHVLHHHPDASPALAGLARIDAEVRRRKAGATATAASDELALLRAELRARIDEVARGEVPGGLADPQLRAFAARLRALGATDAAEQATQALADAARAPSRIAGDAAIPAWAEVELAVAAWLERHWREIALRVAKLEPGIPTRVDRLHRYEVRATACALRAGVARRHHLRLELTRRDDGWFVDTVAVTT